MKFNSSEKEFKIIKGAQYSTTLQFSQLIIIFQVDFGDEQNIQKSISELKDIIELDYCGHLTFYNVECVAFNKVYNLKYIVRKGINKNNLKKYIKNMLSDLTKSNERKLLELLFETDYNQYPDMKIEMSEVAGTFILNITTSEKDKDGLLLLDKLFFRISKREEDLKLRLINKKKVKKEIVYTFSYVKRSSQKEYLKNVTAEETRRATYNFENDLKKYQNTKQEETTHLFTNKNTNTQSI